MTSPHCRMSQLPDDLQALVIDFVHASLGERGLNKLESHRFVIRQLPVELFLRVRMWTDYRGRAYSEAMIGKQVPPIVICGNQWIDGRNRVWAARQEGKLTVECIDLSEVGTRAFGKGLGRLAKFRRHRAAWRPSRPGSNSRSDPAPLQIRS